MGYRNAVRIVVFLLLFSNNALGVISGYVSKNLEYPMEERWDTMEALQKGEMNRLWRSILHQINAFSSKQATFNIA